MKDNLRANRSNTILENNKLPEIIDFCAGWLLGCDPNFQLTNDIHIWMISHLAKNERDIPDFYIKKGTEYIWLNKESGYSKAPVVKVMCQGKDLSCLRKMISNVGCNDLFKKFIGNNKELDVKWAYLNDHIDIIKKFRYIVMSGKEIEEYPDILHVKSDLSEDSLTVGQAFQNQGISAYVQYSSNGKKIFAQCLEENFNKTMEWLSTEVGENSCCKWYIYGLSRYRTV